MEYDSLNILVYGANVKDVEYHKTLWELLLKTFGNSEALKNALISNVIYHGHFMYSYLKNCDFNVVKFLFEFFQKIFTIDQIQQLIRTGRHDFNVLILLKDFTKDHYNDIKKFKLWWEFFKKVFHPTGKFTEFLIPAFILSSHKILNFIFENFIKFKTS